MTYHVECLTKEEEHEVQVCIKELEGAGENAERHTVFEELKNRGQIEKPKLELKTLPTHLKYVFLEDNEAKPIIISSSLKKTEEDQLVQILKKHKAAIGWHISDLKRINPSYCMHVGFLVQLLFGSLFLCTNMFKGNLDISLIWMCSPWHARATHPCYQVVFCTNYL